MQNVMETLTGVGIIGIFCRMVLALICGGIIGIERETKRRAAGFRTHTLICIGASLTTLISQYMIIYQNLPTDPARLGAQVIAGMSFIGAGAIIVTSRRQVKGLTTAAGLWTAAIIGLAIGIGYYAAAILSVALVILAETLLSKFEYYVVSTAKVMNVHVELDDVLTLDKLVGALTEQGVTVSDLEYTASRSIEASCPSAIFSIRFRKKTNHEETLSFISQYPGIRLVEEL